MPNTASISHMFRHSTILHLSSLPLDSSTGIICTSPCHGQMDPFYAGLLGPMACHFALVGHFESVINEGTHPMLPTMTLQVNSQSSQSRLGLVLALGCAAADRAALSETYPILKHGCAIGKFEAIEQCVKSLLCPMRKEFVRYRYFSDCSPPSSAMLHQYHSA